MKVSLKNPEIFKIINICKFFSVSERILEISKPKRPYEKPKIPEDPFKISPNALNFKANPKLIELSQPKIRRVSAVKSPWKVNPKALKYKATERMLLVCKPSDRSVREKHKDCFN